MKKEKKYNVIYKTTNLLSGRYYIGMHSTNNLNDNYLGSGTYLRRAIRKYGKKNFKKEILFYCNSRKELILREMDVVNLQEVAKIECMNMVVGGHGGNFISTEQRKINGKVSGLIHSNKIKTDESYLKKCIENGERLYRENVEKGNLISNNRCDWTGKFHSNETKQKMSKIKKGKGLGENNSQYGTCWVTNEKENKKIYKGDSIPNGWRLGRKF